MRYLYLLGRILFSLIFITAAPRQFTSEGIQHAADLGVPLASLLVPLSGVIPGSCSFQYGRRNRIPGGWPPSPPVLLLLALLVAALLGPGRQNMTKYRSAVGAQQPSTLVLDGISISYTDSGGSGPVVICLHAIGHGARDFEDLSRRLSPQYRVIALDFPNQGNSGPDSHPPALPATLRSSRNSSTSCIFQGLCCLATPLAEPFPSVTPASIPDASRLLCCAIVVDSVLPVPSATSLSERSCNSSRQAGAVLSGFRGPSIATTEEFC
jgi:hypothetical protein